MIEYLFTINDIEFEEPAGFDEIQLSIIRSDRHGVGQEASTNSLQFQNEAFRYLLDLYEEEGIKARAIFAAFSRCGGPYSEFELLVTGRLNFGQWKKQCGNSCSVTLPLEKDSCELTLNSRLDQQVDVDSTTGVNNTTALALYDEMGKEIDLPGVTLRVVDRAENTETTEEVMSIQPDYFHTNTHIAPKLNNVTDSSLGIFEVVSFTEMFESLYSPNRPPKNFPVTVDASVINSSIICDYGQANFSFKMKGSHRMTASSVTPLPIGLTFVLYKLISGADRDVDASWVEIYSEDLPVITSAVRSANFDVEQIINYNITRGDQYVYSIRCFNPNALPGGVAYYITMDKGNYFRVEAPSTCEPSSTQYYMLHELLSHVTEEITNGCLRVKSQYYGRTDSQPYAFPTNGCGGYRFMTSGLKIRRAPEATFFTSLKQLLDGLNAIDNIGIDVEGNDLLIEDVRFFYRDKEIIKCPYISIAREEADESGHYAKIKAGYNKWKVEKINGLDEFNSEREYKTSFDTISTTLDISSNLITGSYPIEITRQQSFAYTGAADTSYDNEIFLICVKREPSPYSGFDVEQGGITDPENIFSPDTVYNWRLRPVANMLRWFKTIATGYRNLVDITNKVFFSSGTGNILASGLQADETCRPEKYKTQEKQDIFYNQTKDYQPIWLNETINFDYPLSLADYNKIKAEPYGYISYQCGTGEWRKGFIKEVKFKINKGTGSFTLKRMYES